jgi:osmotically-inducible protein OsmY
MKIGAGKTTRRRRNVSEKRPIASIAAAAERRLKESAYLDLRYVTCEFRDGVVTLSGRVPTFYLKQVAQTIVGKLDHVEQVVNNLDVSGDASHEERVFWIGTV